MKFSFVKFLSGFNIFNSVTLAKIIWNIIITLIVIALVVGIWYKIFYQRTQEQNAAQITNVTESRDGFNLIKIKIFGFGN